MRPHPRAGVRSLIALCGAAESRSLRAEAARVPEARIQSRGELAGTDRSETGLGGAAAARALLASPLRAARERRDAARAGRGRRRHAGRELGRARAGARVAASRRARVPPGRERGGDRADALRARARRRPLGVPAQIRRRSAARAGDPTAAGAAADADGHRRARAPASRCGPADHGEPRPGDRAERDPRGDALARRAPCRPDRGRPRPLLACGATEPRAGRAARRDPDQALPRDRSSRA